MVLEVDSGRGEEIQRKGERSLIETVCSERIVGKEVIGNTMARIWKISKHTVFQEVERKIFVITFATHDDRQRILEGKPWLSDNALFILLSYDGVMQLGRFSFDVEVFWVQVHDLPLGCMSSEWGKQIGDSVGQCLEVDVEDHGIKWGKCLRIKVEMPLCKVIARGRFINIQGKKLWVHFQYEKLPKIYFKCGWILHRENGCSSTKGDQEFTATKGNQFGSWPRAEGAVRRWFSGASNGQAGKGEWRKGSKPRKEDGETAAEVSESNTAQGWQGRGSIEGQIRHSTFHSKIVMNITEEESSAIGIPTESGIRREGGVESGDWVVIGRFPHRCSNN